MQIVMMREMQRECAVRQSVVTEAEGWGMDLQASTEEEGQMNETKHVRIM